MANLPAELRVRNTFIDVEECPTLEMEDKIRRVKSESDLSTQTAPPSHDEVGHWRDSLGWTSDSAQSADGTLSGSITPVTPAMRKDPSLFASTDSVESSVVTPLSPNGNTDKPLSIGSQLHQEGKCKPCHYAFIKKGCVNGEKCQFCHYTHQHLKKRRPCKEQRDGYKRLIAAMDTVQNPVQAVQKALQQSENKPYLKNKLMDKLKYLQVQEENSNQNQLTNSALHVHNQSYSTPYPSYQAHSRPIMAVPQQPEVNYGRQPNFRDSLQEKLAKLHELNQQPLGLDSILQTPEVTPRLNVISSRISL